MRHFIANIQYNISKVVTPEVAFLNDFGQTPHPPRSQLCLHCPPSFRPHPHAPLLCCAVCVLGVRVVDATTRLRLAHLNEKLTRLERQVDYLEAAVQNLAEASSEAKLTQSQPP